MKNKLIVFVVWLLFAGPVAAQGGGFGKGETAPEFTRSNPKFLAAFKSVSARPSVSTVRVLASGKEAALGVVVGPDGWILTKAHDLLESLQSVTVRFREGKTYDAEVIGVHTQHDLALLKIDARGLLPIEFKDSKTVDVGSWIACVGLTDEPVAVGVVSVATRTLSNKGGPVIDPSKTPFLGVQLYQEPVKGGGAKIEVITPNAPSAKIGLKVDDVILLVAGNKVDGLDSLRQILGKFKPGDEIALRVRRGDIEMERSAKLEKLPAGRGDVQNQMGSTLSSRRGGYATILQHDSVVKPADCGGPIVDLNGRVLGINISRAGRVESWAVPSEVIQPILLELMSGKLSPAKSLALRLTPEEKLAQARTAVAKAEQGKSRFEKDIDDARKALQLAETEFNTYRRTDSADSAERMLTLMRERLLTMNAIAGWKWNHRLEIFDSARENESLAALQKRAKELKVDAKLVDRFFKAQMEAARLLQEERVAGLQKNYESAAVAQDLTKDLRPHIDFLNDELLTTLSKLTRYWNDAELNVQGRIRQRSNQTVAGQGISPAIRAKALEGLLAP